MRPRSISEPVGSGDRYLEFRLLHGTAEALELADAGDRAVGDDFYAASLPRLGFDPVGIRGSAAQSERVEALGERLAAHEREHGVNAIGARKRRAAALMSSCRPSTAVSAPKRRTRAKPSSPEAVASNRAPRNFANWSARLPTPPAAA